MSSVISGTPARPTFLLANAVAQGNNVTAYYGPVRVVGYDTALVEVIVDQASFTMAIPVTGMDTPAATPPTVRDYRGVSNLGFATISVASGSVGEAFLFNFGAAQWLWVRLLNGSGVSGTVTVRVTLSSSGRGA